MLAVKVLARLLVVHGNSYTKKFTEKNGGYTVLKHYLNRWWDIPALWPICFSILFGQDIALLELDKPFSAQSLLDIFVGRNELHIVHPEMLPVITEMLKSGLKSIVLSDGPTNDQSLASANASGTKTSSCKLDGMLVNLSPHDGWKAFADDFS